MDVLLAAGRSLSDPLTLGTLTTSGRVEEKQPASPRVCGKGGRWGAGPGAKLNSVGFEFVRREEQKGNMWRTSAVCQPPCTSYFT